MKCDPLTLVIHRDLSVTFSWAAHDWTGQYPVLGDNYGERIQLYRTKSPFNFEQLRR